MFRPAAARTLLRHASAGPRTALLLRRPAATPRLLSTAAAPKKKRSTLKGTATRWALAGGAVYWYATSSVFADEPKFEEELPEGPTEAETDRPPSLLPTTPLRRHRDRDPKDGSSEPGPAALAADELEEEAGQEGAFNPETGEINWDCPCLGGMAHGPCGDEFKSAFSCFVFSTEEPKGVDCIEKFKGMQACFQRHADIYGSELDGDDDDDDNDEDLEPGADREPPLAAASSQDGATGQAPPAPAGSAGAASRSTAPPTEIAQPETAPTLQAAHRGDAQARSVSDPPTEREAAVAEVDAPGRE